MLIQICIRLNNKYILHSYFYFYFCTLLPSSNMFLCDFFMAMFLRHPLIAHTTLNPIQTCDTWFFCFVWLSRGFLFISKKINKLTTNHNKKRKKKKQRDHSPPYFFFSSLSPLPSLFLSVLIGRSLHLVFVVSHVYLTYISLSLSLSLMCSPSSFIIYQSN